MERKALVQLRKWINNLDPRFVSWEENVDVQVKEDHAKIYLYTNSVRYNITARWDTQERPSYLGCTLSGYKDSPGGRDLADGDFTEETWCAILSDIVSYELISAAKGRYQMKKEKSAA